MQLSALYGSNYCSFDWLTASLILNPYRISSALSDMLLLTTINTTGKRLHITVLTIQRRVCACMKKISPKLRVFTLNCDRLRNVERVLKHKFEEVGGTECSINCVCGGDGLAQHVNDAFYFAALSIGLYQTQVLRVLCPILLSPLE